MLAPALFAYAAFLDRPDGDPSRAAELVREADSLIDEAIASGEQLDVRIADAMSLHGWWKFLDGHSGEAIAMCKAGLRATYAVYGDRPGALIQVNHILAWAFFGDGRFAEAADQFAETLSLMRKINTKRHPFLGLDLAGFADACRKTGRASEALELLSNTVEAWKWCEDPTVPYPRSAPATLFALGMLLNDEGRFADAERAFRVALRGYNASEFAIVPRRIIPRGRVESGLGIALAGQGKLEEAETALLHAHGDLVENRPSFAGDSDAIVREARDAIIAFYKGRGMHAEAEHWEIAGAATGLEAHH
jgi:tetratricopeptide (TPR) repeat protein